MKMRIGFYGPGTGMTQAQKGALFLALGGMGADAEVHHDGESNAAVQFHTMARSLGWTVVVHPYTGREMKMIADNVDVPCPPNVVRQRIVAASMMVIATPKGEEEGDGDATWDVIRMANERALPLLVVWPDGGVRMERMG